MNITDYGAPEPFDDPDEEVIERHFEDRYDAAEQAWEIDRDER